MLLVVISIFRYKANMLIVVMCIRLDEINGRRDCLFGSDWFFGFDFSLSSTWLYTQTRSSHSIKSQTCLQCAKWVFVLNFASFTSMFQKVVTLSRWGSRENFVHWLSGNTRHHHQFLHHQASRFFVFSKYEIKMLEIDKKKQDLLIFQLLVVLIFSWWILFIHLFN